MQFHLLALDIDGTLTDPDDHLRPAVAERVRAVQSSGLRVVLCTGRRYRTTLPLIEALDLEGPVILHNGVVVKDAQSGLTIEHTYLPDDVYQPALAVVRELGPPLVYVDRYHDGVDMLSEPPERSHAFQASYFERNADVVQTVEALNSHAPEHVVMLSCMADKQSLLRLRDKIEREFGDRIRTNLLINKNYSGFILELVSRQSGKWPALLRLCARYGIAPEQVVAIGDDHNDVEMVEQAGLGIAMGNAVEAVRQVADHISADNNEDGLAEAIERFLLPC